VNLADVLAATKGLPWLASALLTLGLVSFVVERFAGLSGPATAIARAWRDRDLRKLRREALLRAERRRLAAEEESAVVVDLRAQLAHLTEQVASLRGSARTSEAHHRAMRTWADGMLRAARAAGVVYIDPPRTGEQPAVALDSRNPAPEVPAPR
jgi:hypothetical protein